MLSVAMKITSDVAANSQAGYTGAKTKRMSYLIFINQECQIAISVNQALIHHRMLPPEQTWITQVRIITTGLIKLGFLLLDCRLFCRSQ